MNDNGPDFDELLELHEQQKEKQKEKPKKEDEKWENARKLFPRVKYPWGVFPPKLRQCLEQLARSCATSATPLAGVALTIIASLLGRTVNVVAKRGWKVPLILWFIDIQPPGSGKTPPTNKLMGVLHRYQKQAEEECKKDREDWRRKPKNSRGPEPRARGYFITDLTVEGMRNDISGHGGTVCHLDEMSAFVNGMNQYKKSGTDGATWRTLWSGTPLRVVRATETYYIEGSRICLRDDDKLNYTTFAF